MPRKTVPDAQMLKLSLGALGIVYGDLGTSPLYTLKECFHAGAGIPPTEANVLGILSLIFWAITLVIGLKYVVLIMRADNNGEGGILALMALAMRGMPPKKQRWILMAGMTGAALFFGDALITPAISVLSALEGLTLSAPSFTSYIVPVAISILFGLFAFQHRGTGEVGNFFGPVMVVWFVVLGLLGSVQIILHPEVMKALNPLYAVYFLMDHHLDALSVLGASFLALTGAEALYADMGHFGRLPIQRAWFWLVFPSLILNYFGQGAVVLSVSEAAQNPFYYLVPEGGLYPLVLLSTIATIIASQAVISGAYSTCRQAVQLGYLPRLQILHTSSSEVGQVFIPQLNRWMMVLVILLVVQFQTSGALASAYGMAVSGIMLTTTLLTLLVARSIWKWSWWASGLLLGGLLVIDLFFFSANLLKIMERGWIPLAVAVIAYAIMTTWKTGREILLHQAQRTSLSLPKFMSHLKDTQPHRVPGTAVFMSSSANVVPYSLLVNMKHNKVLHERIVFLSIVVQDVPYVPKSNRVQIKALGNAVFRVTANYGFKQNPNVMLLLEQTARKGLVFDIQETTFFLSRGVPVLSIRHHLPRWQEKLFIYLSRNAASATEFFAIPYHRVVELRIQFQV